MFGRKLSPAKSFLLLGFLFVAGLVFLGTIYYILHQTPPPQFNFSGISLTSEPVSLELNLSSPDDEIIVSEENLLISGTATKNSILILSSLDSDLPININPDGSFSYTAKLDTGYNRFLVTAFDDNGNSKTDGRTVYFTKEKLE